MSPAKPGVVMLVRLLVLAINLTLYGLEGTVRKWQGMIGRGIRQPTVRTRRRRQDGSLVGTRREGSTDGD